MIATSICAIAIISIGAMAIMLGCDEPTTSTSDGNNTAEAAASANGNQVHNDCREGVIRPALGQEIFLCPSGTILIPYKQPGFYLCKCNHTQAESPKP